ncbi:MAG: pentapeptide repeat-containing protein [Cyanobacteriota bacterium]|nr:pentapeptide repeat-containing protein [Cyanobacteriota bacterium]
MANPTTESGIYHSSPSRFLRIRQLPLLARRGGAFVLEISIVAASALVPFGLGVYAKSQAIGEPVPINSALGKVEEAIVQTLALPTLEPERRVSPLTNLFWSGALVLPVAIGGWQLYLLSQRGQTSPKRWLGVQVVTAAGMPPTLVRVLVREGVGRWSLVFGVAYLIWRFSGAFPGLGILSGLVGLLLAADGLLARFHAQGRTLHDRIAGTYVLDAAQTSATGSRNGYSGNPRATQPLRWSKPNWWRSRRRWTEVEENEAIAAIVLSPQSENPPTAPGLWGWMRQYPGTTLLTLTGLVVAAVLGTFVATQVYIQEQESLRDSKEQNNQMFLDLVGKLTPTQDNVPDERRSTILALGAIDDPRAIPLLVALLGQETEPPLIEATQQALVMTGPNALNDLRQLNQALKNDLEAMEYEGDSPEKATIARRLRATQRAIAKLLTIHSGQIPGVDLSRTDLGRSAEDEFTLVLDGANLAGIRLLGATLTHASLQGSNFYGPGEDGRFETFDDAIADLSEANLEAADLSEAVLSRALLNRANLMQANLDRANLSGASLNGANLSSAQAIGANFQNARLDRASLTGADLTQANFTGVSFLGASLGRANAEGSLLENADLRQSQWQEANLSAANLKGADLENADLSSANLIGANLSGANLSGANLQNADLSFVDLRGANVDGADFQGVKFIASGARNVDEFIERSSDSLQFTLMQGVDFSNVKNLDADRITYLCEGGAIHPQCPR